MAYDQNALPNSLRPINIPRTLAEEARIVAPVTLAASIPQVVSVAAGGGPAASAGAIPVFYPTTVPPPPPRAAAPDVGLVGLNYGNVVPPVANWLPHVPPPVTAGVGLAPGYGYNASFAAAPCGYERSSGGGASNASDRASDEGGDDSASGRKVKFLCSFGGKILPRPSDGVLRYVGGDTRIISVRRDIGFNDLVQKMVDSYGRDVVIKYQLPDEDLDALVTVSRPDDLENMMDEYDKLVERSSDGSAKLRVFLFSELESSSVIRFKDLQDSGQKYVEAVNGLGDGFGGSGGGGGSSSGGGGGIARKGSIASASSTQNSELSGTEGGDQTELLGPGSAGVLSPGGSSASGIPAAKSVTVPASLAQSDHELEILERLVPLHVQHHHQLSYDLQPPGVTVPPPGSYVQAYVGPRHGTFSHTEFVQVPPSQMGFPTHIMGSIGPLYHQQSLHDNIIGMTPTPAPAAHHQFMPPVQITPQSSHVSFNPNPVPVPGPVPGPQLVQQEVRVEHYTDDRTRPRVVQFSGDQNYTTATAYQPPVIAGPCAWNQVPPPDQVVPPPAQQQLMYPEPLPRFDGCVMCQHALPHAHSDPIAHERKESPRSTISDLNPVYHSLRLEDTRSIMQPSRIPAAGQVSTPPGASEVQSPYGAPVQQMQYQAKPEPMVSKRLSCDSNTIGGSGSGGGRSPTSDSQVHESPRDYNFPIIVAKDDNVESGFTYDNLRQMEDLRIRPHEVFRKNDQSGFRVENLREEIVENRPELNLDNPIGKSQMVLDANYVKQNDMLSFPIESYGMAQQPLYCNPEYSGGPNSLAANEVYPSQFEPKSDIRPVLIDPLNPFNGMDESPDSSNSFDSNPDPWILPHDSPFPPPRPNKILSKKDASGDKEDSRWESPTGDGGSYQSSANLDLNFVAGPGHSNLGSAEELIRQELQAVAEGVAASVLHSSTPSNPDSNRLGRSQYASEANQSGEIQYSNADSNTGDDVEDLKTKPPEKANLGFPVSDGLGRLQVIKNSDLEELRELGSGTFGTVYHGKWRGSDVAIKRINDRCFAGKASEQERMREDFWNEAIKLADLHHPNVVAFYGVVLDGPGGSVATVTEYMVNGSLRTALQKNERNLDKRKRLLIAMDVAFGMEYLHGKNIVHFDLKSDNLLVNLRDPHRPICKVGDLGLSKVKRQTLISGGVRGTLPWMAPELLNGSSSLVSEKVDVFSFGIVMWELLTGDEPYADLHYGAIIGGIVSNTLRPPVPESCDPEWRSLMERCWSAEPSERPSFTEIANQLRIITSKVPPKVQPYQ